MNNYSDDCSEDSFDNYNTEYEVPEDDINHPDYEDTIVNNPGLSDLPCNIFNDDF